jgi:23S rRNA (adenine2503-C2)-methyltransferase
MLKDIRSLSETELRELINTLGEKAYRYDQLYRHIWQLNTPSIDEMTDLPKKFRQLLSEKTSLNKVRVEERFFSADKSIKYLLRLNDEERVEGVLIPANDRVTACVSSQVGCSLSCKFCATGYLPLKRNLLFYEIFDQVALLNEESAGIFGRPLTNIVYMGMGEPLLNYRNVIESINRLTSPNSLNISPKRITVSTAGIAKMIKKLGDDNVKFELALSLHAATDEKRSRMMEINESNNLESLADSLKYFYNKTSTRITLEYIIFKDFNDSLEDADQLSKFAKIVPTKINIIEYNPIPEVCFTNATPLKVDKFISFLESKGHIVNVRKSRGKDVNGACGQLALRKA